MSIIRVEDNYPANHLNGEVHDAIGEVAPYVPLHIGKTNTSVEIDKDINLGETHLGTPVDFEINLKAEVTEDVTAYSNLVEFTCENPVATKEELAQGTSMSWKYTPSVTSTLWPQTAVIGYTGGLFGHKTIVSTITTQAPPESVEISPLELYVSQEVDNVGLTKRINITGTNVTRDLTLTTSNPLVTLNKSTIPADSITETATRVDVTISPEELPGTYEYSISNNLTDEVVVIESTVTATPEVIFPESINLGETIESTVSGSFDVVSRKVTEPISLVSSDPNFTVTPDVITASIPEKTTTINYVAVLGDTPKEIRYTLTTSNDPTNEIEVVVTLLQSDLLSISPLEISTSMEIDELEGKSESITVIGSNLSKDLVLTSSSEFVVLSATEFPKDSVIGDSIPVTVTILPGDSVGSKSATISNNINDQVVSISYEVTATPEFSFPGEDVNLGIINSLSVDETIPVTYSKTTTDITLTSSSPKLTFNSSVLPASMELVTGDVPVTLTVDPDEVGEQTISVYNSLNDAVFNITYTYVAPEA